MNKTLNSSKQYQSNEVQEKYCSTTRKNITLHEL